MSDSENGGLTEEWEQEFLFVERNGKTMCLIHETTLSQYEVGNLRPVMKRIVVQ